LVLLLFLLAEWPEGAEEAARMGLDGERPPDVAGHIG
jgi:hypothetical protein